MRRLRVPILLLVLFAATAASALAQTARRQPVYHDVKNLGTGRTSFFPYPQRPVGDPRRLETLTDAASLKRMAETRGMQNDIRRVLALGGISDAQVAADVIAVMRGGFSTQRTGVACDVALPAEGELVECSFAVGGTLPWMAYRPDGRTPGVVRNFRWAGDAPFEAFIFRAYSRGRSYTILIPKPCGNLSISESRPELRVVKLAGQEKFTAGSRVSFSIAVTNAAPAGSMPANNVRLTDALPTGGGLAWSPVASNGNVCTVSGSTLTCNFGTLAPAETRTVTVESTTPTPYDACRVQQNTARATADNAAAAEGSATSSCVPPVLRLAKEAKPFVVGEPVTYTLRVSNGAVAGGSAATKVVLADTLPTNGGLEWATATPASCRLSGAGSATLACDLGAVAAAQTVTVTVTSKPAPVAACVAQANTARVTADGNLSATASATANCAPPQLSVEKTDGGRFTQGGTATFTIVVSNKAAAGASPATNVKLADTLPTNGGLTWNAATATAGTCDLSGTRKNTLACTLGSIAAGQSVTVTVTSTAKTPRNACQAQPNPEALATADGGFTAKDSGSLTCDPGFGFFADGFFGKDRRVRPIDGRETLAGTAVLPNVGPAGGLDFAQCSPMFGFDIGLAKQLRNNWEVAAKAGLAMSVVQKDAKVREHEVLLDVEANKYLTRRGGAFIGGGLSMWDLFHSDTVTPSALVHFGLPFGNHPVHQTHFVGEGRWLLREAGDLANNYQFWGGVRVKF